MKDYDAEIQALRHRVESQDRMISSLMPLMADAGHPLQRVFLVKRTGSKQWQEQTVASGAIADWTESRKVTSDTDPGAIIPRGSSVFLCEIRDGDNYRYIEIGGSTTLVKVTGNLTGGGKYSGVLWAQPSATTVASTGNLTEAEIGQTSAQVMILNAAEVGQSTHDLTAGTPKVSIFQAHLSTAVSTDATPKPIYVIVGIDWENCA